MSEHMRLNDAELEAVGRSLVAASARMMSGGADRPTAWLQSLTGLGSEVDRHLRGLLAARAALADAGKTASELVASLMARGDELDLHISESLYEGFALPGASR